jgi:hypothetical protein
MLPEDIRYDDRARAGLILLVETLAPTRSRAR